MRERDRSCQIFVCDGKFDDGKGTVGRDIPLADGIGGRDTGNDNGLFGEIGGRMIAVAGGGPTGTDRGKGTDG